MEGPQKKDLKQREKGKTHKKWTDKDVMKIINFLEHHRQFEKPTAQQYYKKLLSLTGIEATCETVRFKVRYLKQAFLKAEAWRNSVEAQSIENAEGVSAVIEALDRTCPFYNKLYDVFGYMIPDHENGFIDEMPSQDNTSSSSKDNESLSKRSKKCKLEFVESKARVHRVKPNKKWRDAEVNEIINYIEKEKEFEKPTCRLYYTKFLKQSTMNVTWDLIKWKVRNLKMSFLKAEAWKISNEAKLFEADEGIEKVIMKLQRMCPFYNRLNKIFGINSSSEPDSMDIDGGDISLPNKSIRNVVFKQMGDSFDMNSNYETDFVESEVDVQNELLREDSVTFDDQSRSDNNSFSNQIVKQEKESLSELVCIEKEKAEVQKMEIDLEREKFSKEMVLRQQEIDLKRQELELKRLEIEKDERIRILEIEKEERLARLEIELKYRNMK